MKENQSVLLARLFVLVVFSFFVFVIHYFIFMAQGESYLDVTFSNLYMYIVYFILSLLAGEHILNYMKRKK